MTEREEVPGRAGWTLEDVPYGEIDRAVVRDDALLFQIVASASFVETAADLYAGALATAYAGDEDTVAWLTGTWDVEERRHGAALRRYVETAWPEFDWVRAYAGFLAEFAPLCAVERLEPTRALEMAARCVVETGTATFYGMLSEAAPDPVLRGLAARISRDEVGHYKRFYRYFRKYREIERPGRVAVLRTLLSRSAEVDSEEAVVAFKHVFLVARPEAAFTRADYARFRAGVRRMARRFYPRAQAAKMLLAPLDLPPAARRIATAAAAGAARLLFAT